MSWGMIFAFLEVLCDNFRAVVLKGQVPSRLEFYIVNLLSCIFYHMCNKFHSLLNQIKHMNENGIMKSIILYANLSEFEDSEALSLK